MGRKWGRGGAVVWLSLLSIEYKTMDLPFPRDVCAHITRLACYRPTPSAKAMNQYIDQHPWVIPMLKLTDEYPEIAPSTIILWANSVGCFACRKCNSCISARLHEVRAAHDPDVYLGVV